MEQAIKGQIGQPAACMIDSNSLSAQMVQPLIMAYAMGPSAQDETGVIQHKPSAPQPTVSVDNFVGNWG